MIGTIQKFTTVHYFLLNLYASDHLINVDAFRCFLFRTSFFNGLPADICRRLRETLAEPGLVALES